VSTRKPKVTRLAAWPVVERPAPVVGESLLVVEGPLLIVEGPLLVVKEPPLVVEGPSAPIVALTVTRSPAWNGASGRKLAPSPCE
jgi:hypothetical protein